MRPTMNLVVMLRIIQMNPLQTKNIQGRFIPPRTDNKATQPQQSSFKEGSKENTILNGPAINREKGAQGHPSRSTGNKLQGSAPAAPTAQAGGSSQVPPVTKPSTSHQDPPEHNDTNGSTKASTNGKGPRCYQIKEGIDKYKSCYTAFWINKKTLLYVSWCGKKWPLEQKTVHIIIFCDFCRVTTHITHMCRATKCRPGSPVCIYCGKSNHSFC